MNERKIEIKVKREETEVSVEYIETVMWRNHLNISVYKERFSNLNGYSHMRKLTNSLLRKEVITLDRIGKNNHLSALEIDQRDTTIWKVFILEKQPNFGKKSGTLAVLLGLLPFSFLCSVRCEVSSRLKQVTKTNPEVACLCIGAVKESSWK